MTSDKDDAAPAVVHKTVDRAWKITKDKVVTAIVAAVFGVLAAMGTWLYNASVVSLNDDQRDKLAKALSRDQEFAARVGRLSGTPVGAIIAWPSDEPVPDGWEVCDGREIPADPKVDQIAKVLKTLYGSPKVLGNVKLPDFRGMFLRGAGEVVQPRADDRLLPTYSPKPLGERQLSSVSPLDMFFVDSGISNGARLYPRLDGSVNGPADVKRTYVDVVLHSAKQMGAPAGATETVPINYAVHWIIRVR